MENENNEPSISLQTMVMAIQAIEKEISEVKKIYEQGIETTEDDIWMYDLDRAALNLEEVYNYIINRDQIINFPKYEKLVNRKKSI